MSTRSEAVLKYCLTGRHSYFGPVCTACGHDLMRQLNGERCGMYCQSCNPTTGAAEVLAKRGPP